MPHPCHVCMGRVPTPRSRFVVRRLCTRCWRAVPKVWRRANAAMHKLAKRQGWPAKPTDGAMQHRWDRLWRRIMVAAVEARGMG